MKKLKKAISKRLPQDGRIKVSSSERRLDLRISIIPSLHGEKAVMRLLDLEATSIPLESLGFAQEIYEKVVSLIEKTPGSYLHQRPYWKWQDVYPYIPVSTTSNQKISIQLLTVFKELQKKK